MRGYLLVVKLYAAGNNGVSVWPRTEHTVLGLAAAGLRFADIAPAIRGLEVADYVSGPEPDDHPNRQGEVWVFCPEVLGRSVYVKIKLTEGRQVCCLSFHPPKYPLVRPFAAGARRASSGHP